MPPWIWPSTCCGLIAAADVVRRHDDASRTLHGAEAWCRPRPRPFGRRRRSWRRGCPGRPGRAAWSAGRSGPRRAGHGHRCRTPGQRGSFDGDVTSRRDVDAELPSRRSRSGRRRPGIGPAQDGGAQRLAGQFGGVAADERLAGGAGLAGVRRQVGVAGHQADEAGLHTPSASAAIWTMIVLLPWPISTAPLRAGSGRPRRSRPMTMSDGLDMLVLPMPYHMQAMPTPWRMGWSVRLRAAASARMARQRGRSASRQAAKGGAEAEDLAGGGGVAGAQGVAMAELEGVEAGLFGEHVHQRLGGQGGLRHAEAAEGAGGRVVGVQGPGCPRARRARDRGRWRGPARGWRRSGPSLRRRRC